MNIRLPISFLTILLLSLTAIVPVHAVDLDQRLDFHIPAQPLSSALIEFSHQAKIQVVAGDNLETLTTSGVIGSYPIREALARLLALSGLSYRVAGSSSVTIGTVEQAASGPSTHLAQADAAGNGTPEAGAARNEEPASKSSDERETIEQIIVKDFRFSHVSTGTKTNTRLIEAPQSISVLTADRIEAIGAQKLKEALAYTPGVNTSPWGDESHYDWVYLRGFDAYSPGFYLDGLQLRNGGTWGVWQTENYGAEQVEFLRGPSSALYGQNGPGGIVNVVSKRPLKTPLRRMKAQFGNYNHRQVAGDFSGPLNDDGTWLYRVTGLGQDAELSTGGLPNDRVFVAPALTWRPSDDTTITLLSQFLRIRSGSVWPAFPAIGTLLSSPNGKIPVSTFIGESDFNRYNQDQWMLGYLLEHRLNEVWTLSQNARYGYYDVDYKTFYGIRYVTVNAGDPADPANFRLLRRAPFSSVEDATALLLDNRAQASLSYGDWRHTLLFGLDYQRTRMDVLAIYGGSAPNIDVFAPTHGGSVTLGAPFLDSATTLVQTGFYMQDQIKFDERWVATLSGRYDHASVDSYDRLASAGSEQTDNHFTGRAGLVYLAPSGWAPYISYSESFSPNILIDPITGEPFDPETGRQYEVGLRYQPQGRTDSIGAAVFDVRRENYLIYDSITFVPQQFGETVTRGIELEAVVQPIKALNLTAAYSWTPKAEVISSPNVSEIGKQANPVPLHQFSTWLDYRFSSGINLGLGMRYVGSTRGFNEAAPAKIPAYTLFDALVAYDFGAWTLALNARNLTDKDHVTSCDGGGGSCYYGATRKVVATIDYRW